METSKQLSLQLDLVSQVMYIQYGEVNPGDEAKIERLKTKMLEWKRYVIGDLKNFTEGRNIVWSEPSQEELWRVLVWGRQVRLQEDALGYSRKWDQLLGLHAWSLCM